MSWLHSLYLDNCLKGYEFPGSVYFPANLIDIPLYLSINVVRSHCQSSFYSLIDILCLPSGSLLDFYFFISIYSLHHSVSIYSFPFKESSILVLSELFWMKKLEFCAIHIIFLLDYSSLFIFLNFLTTSKYWMLWIFLFFLLFIIIPIILTFGRGQRRVYITD